MLIDTHVLLWVLTDSDRLGRRAVEMIRSADRVAVSSISLLEIQVKVMLGKLTAPPTLSASLADQGFVELAFHHRHADALPEFAELARHDPFDRALLAQAHVERVPFLTADARLLALGREGVVDATR